MHLYVSQRMVENRTVAPWTLCSLYECTHLSIYLPINLSIYLSIYIYIYIYIYKKISRSLFEQAKSTETRRNMINTQSEIQKYSQIPIFFSRRLRGEKFSLSCPSPLCLAVSLSLLLSLWLPPSLFLRRSF